mgnify:CR=1 FL=1
MDDVRRRAKQVALPDEAAISDLDDAESDARRAARRRALPRRHPAAAVHLLPSRAAGDPADRAGAAHRLRPVGQADRARLPGRARPPWSSASPAPRRASPMPACRSRRRARRSAPSGSAAVAAMIYLVFNEGYSARGDEAATRAHPVPRKAIRLARLLLRLFPSRAGDHGARRADAAAARARAGPLRRATAASCCSRTRTAACWNRKRIAEGLALIDKAMRHRRPGPYQVQAAIAALHARARRAEDTDWAQIDLLYANLERLQPSPVVTLNRAVAVNKVRGPAAALAMIEPLARAAVELLLFPRREGRAAAAARPPRRGAQSPSTGRSRSPTRRPRPPISASISIIWTRKAPSSCRSGKIIFDGLLSDSARPSSVRPWDRIQPRRSHMINCNHPRCWAASRPISASAMPARPPTSTSQGVRRHRSDAHAARRQGPLSAHPSRDQWRLGDAGRCLPRPRPSAGNARAPSCSISRSTTSTPGGSARWRPAPRC